MAVQYMNSLLPRDEPFSVSPLSFSSGLDSQGYFTKTALFDMSLQIRALPSHPL